MMAADDLAPCVTRTLAAMILNMQDNKVLVFQEEGFQLSNNYLNVEQELPGGSKYARGLVLLN